jgi:hypothetical protein
MFAVDVLDPSLRSGDVGCGFAYLSKHDRRPLDDNVIRRLVFNSFTFNVSGARDTCDNFHQLRDDDDEKQKFAAKKEKALVGRIWEVYKKGPPYPVVAATKQPKPKSTRSLPVQPPVPAASPPTRAAPPPTRRAVPPPIPTPAGPRPVPAGRTVTVPSNRHVPLHCSQGLLATYLPEDPTDPRYLGLRGINAAGVHQHVHYRRSMHPDGAGAPFPLRSEVDGKAAWLDLLRGLASASDSKNWWFDYGSDTVARALGFKEDGHDWSALPGAKVIRGVGQWKNSQRSSRNISRGSMGEGVWEICTSSGWKPLTENADVLKKIEEDYCTGRAHLDYTFAYRLDCGCLARARKCRRTGKDHGPEGLVSHMCYVDFEQTIRGDDGQPYFRQVDLWYTLDVRRQLPVRRRLKANFVKPALVPDLVPDLVPAPRPPPPRPTPRDQG